MLSCRPFDRLWANGWSPQLQLTVTPLVATLTALLLVACGSPPVEVDAGVTPFDAGPPVTPDAGDRFADRVTRFEPGAGAGYGQDRLPAVVLGPPQGLGSGAGSFDVVSLGSGGLIELEFTDIVAVDGPGVDLLVFENAFTNFVEVGLVAVSDDGLDWREFGCDAARPDGGCAGVTPVYSNSDNGLSPLDPAVSGGDGFDLFDVGLKRARFVRIRDSGANRFYGAPTGGFDLDAVAVVNGQRADGGQP